MKKEFVVEPSYKCNNSCMFCFNAYHSDKTKLDYRTDKSTEDVRELLRKLKKNGFDKVNFMGGEPTIREDLLELVSYSRELGFPQIWLTSNGRMLGYREYADKLIRAGVTGVQFSLHSHVSETHDSLTRVQGSFDQSVKGVRNVARHGIEMCNKCVVNKKNMSELKGLTELMITMGMDYFYLSFINPTGNAWTYRDRLVPKISDAVPHIEGSLAVLESRWSKEGRQRPQLILEGFPVCLALPFRNFLLELNIMGNMNEKDASAHINQMMKTKGKKKTERCDGCKLTNSCEGIWDNYLSIYSDSEFKPVEGT
jgi:MoaA/NifB/PqqE/SkfB family radical SAM enzyme